MPTNRPFLIATSVFAAYMLGSAVLNFALPLLALEISQSGAGLALILLAGVLADAQAIASVFLMACAINALAGLFISTIGTWGLPRPGPDANVRG